MKSFSPEARTSSKPYHPLIMLFRGYSIPEFKGKKKKISYAYPQFLSSSVNITDFSYLTDTDEKTGLRNELDLH